MKTDPPPARRKFTSIRDKAEYLYDNLLYWLYEREEPNRARPFAERLARMLSEEAAGEEAIFPEGCWSLICEARRDIIGAIRHRENEIRLMERLHEISDNSPTREGILKIYGYDDLSDRLDLLALLYREAGNLDRAIEALEKSKRLCEMHGIRFDGEDILEECLEERLFQEPRLTTSWSTPATDVTAELSAMTLTFGLNYCFQLARRSR